MLGSGKGNKWGEEERVCERETRKRMCTYPRKCRQKKKEGCGRHSFAKIKMRLGDWFWRQEGMVKVFSLLNLFLFPAQLVCSQRMPAGVGS